MFNTSIQVTAAVNSWDRSMKRLPCAWNAQEAYGRAWPRENGREQRASGSRRKHSTASSRTASGECNLQNHQKILKFAPKRNKKKTLETKKIDTTIPSYTQASCTSLTAACSTMFLTRNLLIALSFCIRFEIQGLGFIHRTVYSRAGKRERSRGLPWGSICRSWSSGWSWRGRVRACCARHFCAWRSRERKGVEGDSINGDHEKKRGI